MMQPRASGTIVICRRVPLNRAGFTLIEVLVALLILSVGLLGLAGLQARGLQGNHASLLRSQAVLYAEDILDRMRANRAAALAWDYDIGLSEAPPAGATVAIDDLTEWKAALASALPLGDGSVEVDGNIATVIVQWQEPGADEAQSVTVVTRL